MKPFMHLHSGNKHFFTKLCHHQTYRTQFQKIMCFKNQNVQKTFFLEEFDQFLTQKNYFESTNFEMSEEVVHNLDKSDDDII